jgi:endonuclease YncB( thermonuclease family)
MFFVLRKIVIACGCGVLIGLALLLYQHRSRLTPALDLVRSLRLPHGLEQQPSGAITGRVLQVFSGDSFQLRDDQGRVANVRLTGLAAPDLRSTDPTERLLAAQSRTNLSDLVRSNSVRVMVTYSNEAGAVLGLAYQGETNLNVAMVRAGWAVARRDFMRGLPLKDRYALIRAERSAKADRAANDE